jgi:predicted membrane protein
MSAKTYLGVADVALVGVFCALWAVLNLTLGPLSFSLLHLPALHDFAAFFTLLLVGWVTGKFGTASMVGIIGSVVAIFLGGPPLIVGFAVSAVVFDLLMFGSHHRISSKVRSVLVTDFATLLSAYCAGVIIGVFFTPNTFLWALTFWGVWHLVGGIVTLTITLPIIISLERAGVRRFKDE